MQSSLNSMSKRSCMHQSLSEQHTWKLLYKAAPRIRVMTWLENFAGVEKSSSTMQSC